jgi:hypothetical protein
MIERLAWGTRGDEDYSGRRYQAISDQAPENLFRADALRLLGAVLLVKPHLNVLFPLLLLLLLLPPQQLPTTPQSLD